MDADPEYQSWMQSLSEARKVLPGKLREGEQPRSAPIRRIDRKRRRRPPETSRWGARELGWALAAVFAVAAIGLGLRIDKLRNQLATPVVLRSSTSPEIVFDSDDRRIETLIFRETARHVAVYLILSEVEYHPAYRVRLLEEEGGVLVWESAAVARDSEFLLLVPRALLRAGTYRLRLYGRDEQGKEKFLD
ncbi:MAG: hypothetical protein GY856_22100, partial [bacterium]|nr:hypothetical protein [bacterium]